MTLSCQECKQQLLPFGDPSQPNYDRQRHCYLPPICYGCGNYEKLTSSVVEYKTIYLENVTDGRVLKDEADIRNLQEKVEKLIVAKKKRGYTYDK